MQINFRYSHIKLEQFATLNGTTNRRPVGFQTDGEVQTGFNAEAKTIIITVTSNVKYEGQLLLTIKVSSFFEIELDSWDGLKEDGFVVINRI